MPVKWYEREANLFVGRAIVDAVAETAKVVEDQSRINITRNGQVDTGFMRESAYHSTGDGQSSYAESRGNAISRNREATMAPERTAPKKGSAVVAVGASYAIFQETKNSFLFRALEQAAGSKAERAISDISEKYD